MNGRPLVNISIELGCIVATMHKVWVGCRDKGFA